MPPTSFELAYVDDARLMYSVQENSLFGYDIPMPRSDLAIALVTVVGFLPFTVLAYNIFKQLSTLGSRK